MHDYLSKHKRAGSAEVRINLEKLGEKFDNICNELLYLEYHSEEN